MAIELNAATLDAVLKSRRVARKAKLLAQAKGEDKWTWKSILAAVCLLALIALIWWSKDVSDEMLYTVMLVYLLASEASLSRRLNAIVRLLEEHLGGDLARPS